MNPVKALLAGHFGSGLVRASDHNRHRTEAICLNGSHDTSATVGHLLSDQTTIQSAKTHTAILLGDVKIHEAGLVSLLQDWPGVLPGPVVVRSHRDNLVLGELLRQVQELLLLLGDREVETH